MILVCQYLYTVDGTGELYTMVAICHLNIFKNHQMFCLTKKHKTQTKMNKHANFGRNM